MAFRLTIHKEYDELVDLLLSLGMDVPDREHAIKKISQVTCYQAFGTPAAMKH